jgi:uncharacterized protein
MKTPVALAKDGINISLYVQPGAAKTGWSGLMGESVKLKVAARPVEGEANKEVCQFIAGFFSVTKSCVSITHGLTGRHKTVHVVGDAATLMAKARPLIEVQGT